jgi:hypothetical protein
VRSNDQIRHERRKAIRRVIIVVVACSLCYLVRAFCVTLICLDFFTDEYYTDQWFSDISWYLCSQWIPTLLPAYIMLYVCRPIPRVKNPGQRELRIRSSSFTLNENGHSIDSNDTDSRSIFASNVSSVRMPNGVEFLSSSRGPTTISNSSSVDKSANSLLNFGEYYDRYSNDMYADVDDVASYDYDPEGEGGACTPGRPFTVDEILESSEKYGASTSPLQD